MEKKKWEAWRGKREERERNGLVKEEREKRKKKLRGEEREI